MSWQTLMAAARSVGQLLNPEIWSRLWRMTGKSIRRRHMPTIREPVFVLLNGHPGAGKTTLCRVHPLLSRFAQFDCDRFHILLAEYWPELFQPHATHPELRFRRSVLIALGMVMVLWRFRHRHEAVVCDFVNYNPWRRRILLTLMRSFGYRCVIIWVDCEQSVRTSRLLADPGRQTQAAREGIQRLIHFEVRSGHGPAQAQEGETYIHYRSHTMRPEQLDLSSLLPGQVLTTSNAPIRLAESPTL